MAPTLVLTPRLANSFEAAKAAEKESGAFVVPTAVSLKAHEARLAVPYKRDILRPCDASSTAVSVSASERPRGSFWDSERMVEAKVAETSKPEREIVTSVDDWYDLGALFGCFTARER
ncbi:unnamed protein product [Effrenium voratum]|nr:unnamed protein product [Effrenium voratum]CAJ1448631.1 unnamed protein product [Effrenium voratum]